jgi:hypothetical protein
MLFLKYVLPVKNTVFTRCQAILVLSLAITSSAILQNCGKKNDSAKRMNGLFEFEMNPEISSQLGKYKRFPLGETLYLPNEFNFNAEPLKLGDEKSISKPEWSLLKFPASENPVSTKLFVEQKYLSYTPSVFGEHIFEDKVSGKKITINVVDRKTIPFQNYNYYPTQALLPTSDNELWLADTLRAKLSLLDTNSLGQISEFSVGSWPVALAEFNDKILVVQKGSDSIGVFNKKTKTLEKSIWVGDEPSEIVVAKNLKKAFVSLSTQGAVAVLNLETESLVETVKTVKDARGLALSKDEKRLFVSSFRSGQTTRYPYENDPLSEEKDIELFETETMKSLNSIFEVGTTIQSIQLNADNSELYVSRLKNNTAIALQSANGAAFQYEVVSLNVSSNGEFGKEIKVASFANLSEGKESLISPVNIKILNGLVWVASEGNDTLVALYEENFKEHSRHVSKGRPRSLAVLNESIYSWGHQGFVLTKVTADKQSAEPQTYLEKEMAIKSSDPRAPELSQGQAYFTGAGASFAKNWSCNGCHTEGRTDTLVWNAGPVKDTHVSKPFFWLEGTHPLGWQGYMSSLSNYSNEVHTNVGRRPTTQTSVVLEAYLASLTVPPASNSYTLRDGSLSIEGRKGLEIFNSKGNCSACHALPLGTSRQVMEKSSTEDKADIPSVVGAYSHGIWLKHGEARTLEAATENMLNYAGAKNLSESEKTSIIHFLNELTGRDFFVLALASENLDLSPASPSTIPMLPLNEPLDIKFSLPILSTSENLEKIYIETKSKQKIELIVELIGARKVRLKPKDGTFPYDEKLTLVLKESLESSQEGVLIGAHRFVFQTPKAPIFKLEGKYILRVQLPKFIRGTNGNSFDKTQLSPLDIPFTALSTLTGANAFFDFGQSFTFNAKAVLSGKEMFLPPIPIPANPFSFADSFVGFRGTMVDLDSNGVVDFSSGQFTYSGPGFIEQNLPWEIVREFER